MQFGSASRGRSTLVTRCMATPIRVARISRQITREISQLFVTDKVIQKALNVFDKGNDVQEITTVTDVVVSGDLQVAKVYISLYDTHDRDPSELTWERLCKLQPYVRSVIGQRISLKRTPEVRFIRDNDFDKMHKAFALLRRLEEEEEREERRERGEVVEEVKKVPVRRMRWTVKKEASDIPDASLAFADMFQNESDS